MQVMCALCVCPKNKDDVLQLWTPASHGHLATFSIIPSSKHSNVELDGWGWGAGCSSPL